MSDCEECKLCRKVITRMHMDAAELVERFVVPYINEIGIPAALVDPSNLIRECAALMSTRG